MKKRKIFFVTITFLLLLNICSMTVFAETGGSATLTVEIPYQVTLQVENHGKVTADGTDYTGNSSFQKAKGTVVTYTFHPDALYEVGKVIYNGAEVTDELSGNSYTAPALTENASLSVSFRFLGIGGDTVYTVCFDTNGRGTAPAQQSVIAGNKAVEPTAPIASGWMFSGWFEEKECINAFDFSTPIKKDMILYAQWTKEGSIPGTTTYDLITSVSGGHGTISENEVNIPAGEKRTVVFTPESGYKVQTVTVNGTDTPVTDHSLYQQAA